MAKPSPSPALLYILTAAALLLFIAFSRTPSASPRRRTIRRLAPHASTHARVVFDPLVDQLERRAEDEGLPIPDTFPDEMRALAEYFGQEGQLNTTERLMFLFPLLDRMPEDGLISFEELQFWNQRQAMDRLMHGTRRRMMLHDRDRDGGVTLREFLSYLSDAEISNDLNEKGHGKAGWWKEQFVNADRDENGSLNETELNDFLHPEDSSNPKIQMWLQREMLGEMDANGDGRLNLTEFRDRTYDIYKHFPDFLNNEVNNPEFHTANAEKRFLELDANRDEFLTAEELKPIIHQLHPGELSHATYFSKYLMHEADDDKDGKLSLKEMLSHHHAFYTTVVDEVHSDDDDDDYEYDYHDELRR